MKRQIKRWAFRLAVTALLIAGLLLVIILNPVLTYANKTLHNKFTIFHNQPLNKTFSLQLDEAVLLLKRSEFYNPGLKLDICLNDGSKYPQLIQAVQGQAFAWGFYNKVVLQGTANYKENYVEFNGYKWNIIQLLAHEMTHCLQFDKFDFWKSNPVANIPAWKWEGYAEYIARQNGDQKDLAKNIDRLTEANKRVGNSWAISFADSTIAPKSYYNYWVLVQYCMDVKKMSYQQIIEDSTKEEMIRQQIMRWYGAII